MENEMIYTARYAGDYGSGERLIDAYEDLMETTGYINVSEVEFFESHKVSAKLVLIIDEEKE